MVIQRWQSVLLLLAAIAMVVYMFMPVMTLTADGSNFALHTLGGGESDVRSILLLCLEALIAVMNVVTIFKFRDLKFQRRLCSVIVLLDVALFVTIGVVAFMQKGHAIASITPWIALPFVSMFLTLWASSRIKADRKKLSDADRLR